MDPGFELFEILKIVQQIDNIMIDETIAIIIYFLHVLLILFDFIF